MAKNMTNQRLEKLESILRTELSPLKAELEAAKSKIRMKIEKEVRDDTGITELLNQREAMKAEVKKIEEQLCRAAHGDDCGCVDSNFGFRLSYGTNSNAPYTLEIDRRMSKLNGVLKDASTWYNQQIRAVWLLDAPDSFTKLLDECQGKRAEHVKAIEEAKQLYLGDGK